MTITDGHHRSYRTVPILRETQTHIHDKTLKQLRDYRTVVRYVNSVLVDSLHSLCSDHSAMVDFHSVYLKKYKYKI